MRQAEIRQSDLVELMGSNIGEVPCNGCTRCCHRDAVRILPGEDESQYKTETHSVYPNHRMLAHKKNGDCYYLGEKGCTIQDTKPQLCRQMDCRLIALRTTYTQARKIKYFPIQVWRKGKELIREFPR